MRTMGHVVTLLFCAATVAMADMGGMKPVQGGSMPCGRGTGEPPGPEEEGPAAATGAEKPAQ